MDTVKTLCEMARINTCDKGPHLHAYTKTYGPLFEKWRNDPISALEIGIQFGFSARLWLEYFTNANIYGVDVVNCHADAHLEDNPRWKFFLGDQRDKSFWESFKASVPPLNIVIDDGCHQGDAIQMSFQCLWDHVASGGVYIVEDVHCLWDKEFSSPVHGSDFVRWLFETVNWRGKFYHGKPHHFPYTLNDFEKTVDSVHLSKGLIIIKKSNSVL